ncbi:Type I restriction-modification system, specificity subunit S [Nitrincola lacisaponensis]|uniref:Type I restriction-modification system, specificity subunit S n=1 Tax=Nitrincola lacisaponensis TaxID=267850 RepID=A0A063Y7L2_9GAMM|nr:restriction endonuclease subunit S [Nitrincola lacisaponensis]KDE40746.1 Type I restriction-modification system, specificity subunit S [Nitrincola lacisaponensis]
MKWPMVKIGDVSEILSGNAWKSSGFTPDKGSLLPVIRIQNVSNQETEFVYWGGDVLDKYRIENGDLLLSLSGNVKLCQWKFGSALLNQRVVRLTPLKMLDKRYFYWALDRVVLQLEALAKHAVIANVSVADLKSFEIPLPPLAEQKRIAAILDKADAIRRKRQQAIQLADDFLRAVFLDMFGDPSMQGWKWATVEEVADLAKGSMRTGPFGSDLKHSEFVDSGVAVLGIDNAVQNRFVWGKERFITNEKYEKLKRYTVKAGDVIITIMGTCGRCAVVPDDIPLAVNTKHLCCITLDRKKCLPEFLHSYFLMHPTSKEYLGVRVKGAIMDGLNLGMIKEMPIPLVPIDTQIKYVEISKSVKRSLDNLNLVGQENLDLFSSLSQQAFRGEL